MSNREYSVEGEWNGFIFKYIKPEDHPKLLELIMKYLIPCMEICGYDEKIEAEDWEMLFVHLLNDENQLHFMALDKESGEIAGFRIIGTGKKGEPETMPPFKHNKTKIIFQELVDLGIKCRIDDYTDGDYADFFGMCVIPKYRQRGLCTELYRKALELSKSRGFTIAKVSFASPFSRKAGFTNGYKQLGKVKCIDFKDENGVCLKPDIDPQWYLDMGIFQL